jgi:hypothetical protein
VELRKRTYYRPKASALEERYPKMGRKIRDKLWRGLGRKSLRPLRKEGIL